MPSPIPSWSDFSPAGWQNCKPWSERPQSARADSISWNNDWSSSILGFRCKKFKQNIVLDKSRYGSAKSYFEFFDNYFGWVAALSTTCPYFCPGGLQVLILLKRTKLQAESCSSWFIRNCKILFFKDFYTSYEASIASPCVVLWEINRKRAFPKALRPTLIRVGGIYCNDSCVDASFTLLW